MQVVLANAVFTGIDLEVSLSVEDEFYRPPGLQVAQYIFTFLFTVELTLRIAAEGRSFFCSDDFGWNYLDIFIVASSMWEVAVDIAVAFGRGDLATIEGVASLKAFRIIRITRLMKAVRIIRLLRFVLALRSLIQSIASTLKSLVWAIVLLALIIYVFAVLFCQIVNDIAKPEEMGRREHENVERYFSSLGVTMLSLFMSIAGGVSWEELIYVLQTISVFWVATFLFFVRLVILAHFMLGDLQSPQKVPQKSGSLH